MTPGGDGKGRVFSVGGRRPFHGHSEGVKCKESPEKEKKRVVVVSGRNEPKYGPTSLPTSSLLLFHMVSPELLMPIFHVRRRHRLSASFGSTVARRQNVRVSIAFRVKKENKVQPETCA